MKGTGSHVFLLVFKNQYQSLEKIIRYSILHRKKKFFEKLLIGKVLFVYTQLHFFAKFLLAQKRSEKFTFNFNLKAKQIWVRFRNFIWIIKNKQIYSFLLLLYIQILDHTVKSFRFSTKFFRTSTLFLFLKNVSASANI